MIATLITGIKGGIGMTAFLYFMAAVYGLANFITG